MTIDTKTEAPAIQLDDYVSLLGQAEVDEIRTLASKLSGRTVQMVNSTAMGGGVAEILNRLIPLIQELGLNIRWDVITGGDAFFEITKAFHNALHGGPYQARQEDFDLFLATNDENRRRMQFDCEFVVIHDPQPIALIEARQGHENHWIWRCHIDLSHPNQDVWAFLRPFVFRYDGALFSSPSFARQLPIPQFLAYPSIDPLSDKNKDLEPEYVSSVLERFKIDPSRPILTQISRFDRLKDPVGVVRAYQIVKRYADCQLVLAGGGAADDPEGGVVLEEVKKVAAGDPDIFILDLPPWSALEINALQHASTIIIQKSLREGFGLTVTEALWKKKPTVASAVGGIPAQVIHKHTGLLAHSVEGTAYQIRFLLSNPEMAQKLGEQGHEHVREHFLITSNVKRYLTLFLNSAGIS
ncbi:MAG TPA: glycosyltransferase [Candidatus Acidoferrales bacterium]